MEGLVLYTGWAKVMARPEIRELNVNANCTVRLDLRSIEDGQPNTCSAGNPDLKPYRATQKEVAISWYPNKDSIVSVSYFEKQLTSFLGPTITFFDRPFFSSGPYAGIPFDVRQKGNIEGVTTSGVEFQTSTVFEFLPAPFNNIGADFNITFNDAEDIPYVNGLDGTALPLLEQSEVSYNLGAFYEDDNWTIRLAYNYRDEYLRQVADRSGSPSFQEDAGPLDGKIMYTVGDSGFTAYADFRNLLNAVEGRNSGERRSADLRWAGRTFSLGFIYQL